MQVNWGGAVASSTPCRPRPRRPSPGPGTQGGGGGGGAAITGLAGKCVDVAGANSANGTAVQLYDCNGTAAQQWTVGRRRHDPGARQVPGRDAGRTADGAQVQLYDCNGTGAQQWTYDSRSR